MNEEVFWICNNATLIAEIIPGAYDAIGRKVIRPDLRRKGLRPTFPMGRYVSQPLSVKCETVRDVRKFLSTCRGVSDKEQFGKDDYWQPPEHFEKTKKGDCDDFALWTWRQFLEMGYNARFVAGRLGGVGHAWVTFEENGKYYLVEPQYRGRYISTVVDHSLSSDVLSRMGRGKDIFLLAPGPCTEPEVSPDTRSPA